MPCRVESSRRAFPFACSAVLPSVFRSSSFGLGEALAQLVSDHTDSETGRTAAGLIRSRITQALSQMAVSGVWAPEEEGA